MGINRVDLFQAGGEPAIAQYRFAWAIRLDLGQKP